MEAVSSKTVIHRNSAMSIIQYNTVLTQQCLRIMLNCNIHIGWENISEQLSFYTARMQASGHDHNLRLEIVKSANDTYNKSEDADETQLYRRREWRRKERWKEKTAKNNKWYEGGRSSVLFVIATPQSVLRNQIQKEIDKTPFKIKVIEKSRTKLTRHLQKNDPFKKKECRNKDERIICKGSDPGACRDPGVSYKINCSGPTSGFAKDQEQCKFGYTDQTGVGKKGQF